MKKFTCSVLILIGLLLIAPSVLAADCSDLNLVSSGIVNPKDQCPLGNGNILSLSGGTYIIKITEGAASYRYYNAYTHYNTLDIGYRSLSGSTAYTKVGDGKYNYYDMNAARNAGIGQTKQIEVLGGTNNFIIGVQETACSDNRPNWGEYWDGIHYTVSRCADEPQCNDGIDNDDDGYTDYPDDPDCENADDDNEIGDSGECVAGLVPGTKQWISMFQGAGTKKYSCPEDYIITAAAFKNSGDRQVADFECTYAPGVIASTTQTKIFLNQEKTYTFPTGSHAIVVFGRDEDRFHDKPGK